MSKICLCRPDTGYNFLNKVRRPGIFFLWNTRVNLQTVLNVIQKEVIHVEHTF